MSLAALGVSVWLWLGPALPASAGGYECPHGQGSYTMANSSGKAMPGSFDAFTYDMATPTSTVWMTPGFRLVSAFVGTQGEAWAVRPTTAASGAWDLHSRKPFTWLQLCITPDSTGGWPQLATVNDNYAASYSSVPVPEAPTGDPLFYVALGLIGTIFGLITVMRINAYEHRQRLRELSGGDDS